MTAGTTSDRRTRTPMLTSKEALAALDAALNAYDLGHGVWPMMTVAERIQHVEVFLGKMQAKREEVVEVHGLDHYRDLSAPLIL